MKNTRKAALAILAGITVTGVVGAAAASLGDLRAESLGADSAAVEACDTNGIDVDFTTVYANGDYELGNVVFGDVSDDCDDLGYKVTLSGAAGSLGEVTGDVELDTGSFTVGGFAGVDAEAVTGVSLVIAGVIVP